MILLRTVLTPWRLATTSPALCNPSPDYHKTLLPQQPLCSISRYFRFSHHFSFSLSLSILCSPLQSFLMLHIIFCWNFHRIKRIEKISVITILHWKHEYWYRVHYCISRNPHVVQNHRWVLNVALINMNINVSTLLRETDDSTRNQTFNSEFSFYCYDIMCTRATPPFSFLVRSYPVQHTALSPRSLLHMGFPITAMLMTFSSSSPFLPLAHTSAQISAYLLSISSWMVDPHCTQTPARLIICILLKMSRSCGLNAVQAQCKTAVSLTPHIITLTRSHFATSEGHLYPLRCLNIP